MVEAGAAFVEAPSGRLDVGVQPEELSTRERVDRVMEGTALFVLIPTTSRIIAMTSAPPPGAAGAGGPPPGAGGPPPGAGGPPPELLALIKRVQRAGASNAVLIVLVVLLMVLKPAL